MGGYEKIMSRVGVAVGGGRNEGCKVAGWGNVPCGSGFFVSRSQVGGLKKGDSLRTSR